MSDGSDPTPSPDPSLPWNPATWEDHAVFRESFLRKLPPKEAAACRLLGRRIYQDRHESLALDEVFDPTSWLAGDLEGAVAELAFLAGYLGDTARAPQEHQLGPEELALAALAGEARDLITGLKVRIEAQLRRGTACAGVH